MPEQFKSLRAWLLVTVVGVLISVAGCYGTHVTADIDELKSENTQRRVENATTKQSVDDFRADFDEFKKDVKDDIARHHQGNR